MHRFSSVILVDGRGWLLLQERDEHPVIDPDRWGLVGGHVEPGEEHEPAAHRELAEETGITGAGLVAWRELAVFHAVHGTTDAVHVFAGATDLTDADITCTEGRRIVFVDPDLARKLELTTAAALAVPQFLDSDLYRRLKDRP